MNYKFEENFTKLSDLHKGDIFLSKSNSILIYLDNLGSDNHRLLNTETGKEFNVPHGRFPVFKELKKNITNYDKRKYR